MAEVDSRCPDSPYLYCPNTAAAIIFSFLWAGANGLAFFRFFALKTWFFYWMLIAMTCELIGMIARSFSTRALDNRTAFIIQYITVVLAPSLMAAACYMTFGRLVWYISPHKKLNFRSLWIPPRWITPIFVTFDVVTFLIQFFGISQVAVSIKPQGKTDFNKLQNGLKILRFGLILQMVCFGLFAFIGFHFLIVTRSWTVPLSRARRAQWQRLNIAVNVAATLITLRAFYRIFEFSSSVGTNAHGAAYYLYSHEWPFYVLDCLPILIACSSLNLFHPGEYLPEDFTRFRLIKKNIRRVKYYEEHGWPMTVTGDQPERETPHLGEERPGRQQDQPFDKAFSGNLSVQRPTYHRSVSPS